ncbi:hypothetical protein HAZT_HAZT005241 [Hyalella azteca]|uniref:Uncharacterized protein n=1 Tax=Hyalella azteca TaxID=294128 RepID=A0A6A0H7A0_HYAAZ|nr:hypothetical protein HAZT_HAZT005241 [Hyalella azteca]
MDEYFKEYKVIPADGTNGEGDTADLPDLLQVDQQSESNDHSKPLPTTTVTTATIAGGTTREIRAYKDDQLNLLNGDDYEDEDECIYTYKEGSGFDDVLVRHLLTTCISCGLPNYRPEGDIDASSSINPLNIGGNTHKEHPQQENESLFSPDMDFLEMDFDPGSTAEDAESSDCDDNCYPGIKMLATPNACSAPGSSCKVAAAKSNIVNGHVGSDAQIDKFSSVLCRRCESDPSIVNKCEDLSSSSGAGGDGGDFEGEKFSSWVVKGSLPPKISDPSIDVNTTPSTVNARDDSCPRVLQKTMVWTERQATARQVLQLQRSACGLSAVANVLLALDQHIPPSALGRHVVPRCRAEAAPLVDYLLSRACAGTTHADLIDGMTRATNGSVVAHFFHMFPKRAVQLSRWLASWISKGGVAVCTLNLQRGVSAGQTIPDAWHHQMVFGVGPQGVYLTNPVECVSEERLSEQLCSERVLLVRRDDIVRHWDPSQALHALLQQQDQRWRDMNVLGQVSLVLKEQQCSARRSGCSQQRGRERLTSHVGIPAAYHSGVTVFMRSDNSHAHELLNAPDLPLLE